MSLTIWFVTDMVTTWFVTISVISAFEEIGKGSLISDLREDFLVYLVIGFPCVPRYWQYLANTIFEF